MQLRSLRSSERVLVSPTRYGWKEDQVSFVLVMEAGDLSSYKEAIEVDDSDKWAIAMEKEMESLERNQTWDLQNLLVLKRWLQVSLSKGH